MKWDSLRTPGVEVVCGPRELPAAGAFTGLCPQGPGFRQGCFVRGQTAKRPGHLPAPCSSRFQEGAFPQSGHEAAPAASRGRRGEPTPLPPRSGSLSPGPAGRSVRC